MTSYLWWRQTFHGKDRVTVTSWSAYVHTTFGNCLDGNQTVNLDICWKSLNKLYKCFCLCIFLGPSLLFAGLSLLSTPQLILLSSLSLTDLLSTNRSSVFSGHHGQLALTAVYLDEYRDRLFLGGKDVLYSLLLGPTSSESKEVGSFGVFPPQYSDCENICLSARCHKSWLKTATPTWAVALCDCCCLSGGPVTSLREVWINGSHTCFPALTVVDADGFIPVENTTIGEY